MRSKSFCSLFENIFSLPSAFAVFAQVVANPVLANHIDGAQSALQYFEDSSKIPALLSQSRCLLSQ